MKESLDQILHHLENPDISSSALPLLVVMLILFSGSLFAIIKIFSILRVPMPQKPQAPSRKGLLELIFLNAGRWRAYFQLVNKAPQPRAVGSPSELDQLRELVRKLEQANALERELHAKALRKITELQGELQALFLKREEEQKLFEFERARRARLEDKVAQLETQLQGAISETERIFEQSVNSSDPLVGLRDEEMIALPDPEVEKQRAAATQASLKDILSDFPPPGGTEPEEDIVAKQAAEIKMLKGMLRDIREKMSTPTRKAG